MTQEQLVFSFPTNEHFSFQHFIKDGNEELLCYLEKLSNGNFSGAHKINLLIGAPGLGRSHLLTATYSSALARGLNTLYINMNELLAMPTQVLLDMGNVSLLCIDDIQAISGHSDWEAGLFDLINRTLEQNQCHLVLSANQLPKDIGFKLPDLVSRLQWGQIMQLKELPENAKIQFMIKKASERGFDLPKEVARYILSRMPRDLCSLQDILNKVDKLSLQSQRKLTIPFVKEVFGLH